ncbi:xylose isomerase-like protein [Gaertneriomyces semiglobifer]|nr:xylose isomerase-like protein [Gaertneriomyces semiglobifer]
MRRRFFAELFWQCNKASLGPSAILHSGRIVMTLLAKRVSTNVGDDATAAGSSKRRRLDTTIGAVSEIKQEVETTADSENVSVSGETVEASDIDIQSGPTSSLRRSTRTIRASSYKQEAVDTHINEETKAVKPTRAKRHPPKSENGEDVEKKPVKKRTARTTSTTTRVTKTKSEAVSVAHECEEEEACDCATKAADAKDEEDDDADKDVQTTSTARSKPKEKEIILQPMNTTALWSRARSTGKYVGAHVSASGGCYNAIVNGVDIGAAAIALFIRSQRKWTSPPMLETHRTAFGRAVEMSAYDIRKHVVPHGSYLINLANGDAEKSEKAYEAFLDELTRCESVGIGMYNFHPGSALGGSREDGIRRVAEAINRAHRETQFITILIENCAGQGNTLGCRFEELRAMIDGVEDKQRVGVCLDTCHMFASGYDMRTQAAYDATMSEFGRVIGFEYLKAVHLNDSKVDLGAKKDRHESIGKGYIGLEGFRCLMNDDRFNGVPMVLETPDKEGGAMWKREIDLLYGLVGKQAGEV